MKTFQGGLDMKSNTKQTDLNQIMMAITFAEAGEHETAKGMLEQCKKQQKRPETRVEQRPTIAF